MLAVFKTGGKQYAVKEGQILKVEKVNGKKGDNISFSEVLAISNSSDSKIGSPLVENAIVQATIVDQVRDKKIIVFKKRRRQNYRLTQGHRQYITILKIKSIDLGLKKSASTKKSIEKKEVKKEVKEEVKKNTIKTKKKAATKKTTVAKKSTIKKKATKKA